MDKTLHSDLRTLWLIQTFVWISTLLKMVKIKTNGRGENWGIFIVQQTLIFQGNISFVWQEPRLSHRSDPLISPTWKDKRKKNKRLTENPLSCTRKSSAFLLCDYFWLFCQCGVVMGGGGTCFWQSTFVRFVSDFPQKEWTIIAIIHQSAAWKEELKAKWLRWWIKPAWVTVLIRESEMYCSKITSLYINVQLLN